MHAGFCAKKPEENGSLRKPMHLWNDNVRVDVKEIGFWGTDCINLAHQANIHNLTRHVLAIT